MMFKYHLITILYPEDSMIWNMDGAFKNQKLSIYFLYNISFNYFCILWRTSMDIIYPAPVKIIPPFDFVENLSWMSGFN